MTLLAKGGHNTIVNLLLDAGANVNHREKLPALYCAGITVAKFFSL